MNNYWMLLLLLQIVGLQCAEEVIDDPKVEMISDAVGENNDHFIGEIAANKNSIAYLGQHYGVAKAHDNIFKAIMYSKSNIKSIQAIINSYQLDIFRIKLFGFQFITLYLLES